MKRITLLLAMLTSILVLTGCSESCLVKESSCQSLNTPTNNSDSTLRKIYKLEHSRVFRGNSSEVEYNDLMEELIKIHNTITNNLLSGKGVDNFILYVHGKSTKDNPEPQKSLQEIIPELETGDSSIVLMLTWEGSYGDGPHPEGNAEKAGMDLRALLNTINDYTKENPGFSNIRRTLITHSMGNILLKKVLTDYCPGELSPNLFNTIVLSSADVPAEDHNSWLRNLDFGQNIYVTLNEDDWILRASGVWEHGVRLGKEVESTFWKKYCLAPNVNYVDFSSEGELNHRWFVKSGRNNNKYVSEFYSSVLDGKAFVFKN